MRSCLKSWILFISMTLIAGIFGASSLAVGVEEYQVKAAYIFNFAKFIEWPQGAFPHATAPFIVGVLGADPFGSSLEHTFEGQSLQGRPFSIKRLKEQTCPDCHLLFISSSESEHLEQILEANRGKSVVTIGDIPKFNQRGGMIYLFLDQNKVRFAINSEATQYAGVKMSSQLLKLSYGSEGH